MIGFSNQGQDRRLLEELVLCSVKKTYFRIKTLFTSNADMPKLKLSVTSVSVDNGIVEMCVTCRLLGDWERHTDPVAGSLGEKVHAGIHDPVCAVAQRAWPAVV